MLTDARYFDHGSACLVGWPAIDAAHQEFIALVDRLLVADGHQLEAALLEFERHALAHFALEERLMDEHDCPASDCHKAEHRKVLTSVQEVQGLLRGGESEVVRELAVALRDWFPGHSDYMDASLVSWVSKRTRGGVPVVLRRRIEPVGEPAT